MAPKRTRSRIFLAAALAVAIVTGSGTRAVALAGIGGGSAGTYAWPVVGPVIRGFEPPPDPYQPGHRGIDIGAAFGTPVLAAQDGTVAFAGWVAGALFVSVDHPDGHRSTYSWLSAVLVAEGDPVTRGEPIADSGHGHPDVLIPHLHFGVRLGSQYLDPMLFLEAGNVAGLIHLAPLEDGFGSLPRDPGRPGMPPPEGRSGPVAGCRPPTMAALPCLDSLVAPHLIGAPGRGPP